MSGTIDLTLLGKNVADLQARMRKMEAAVSLLPGTIFQGNVAVIDRVADIIAEALDPIVARLNDIDSKLSAIAGKLP